MKNKINLIVCSFCILLSVFLILLAFFLKNNNSVLASRAYTTAVDLVGSRSGTTTTGVAFANNSATNTYRSIVGEEADSLTYTIKATVVGAAALGTANAQFSFIASNDPACGTTTSTTLEQWATTTGQINWFDVSPNLLGVTNTLSLPAGTGTIIWNPSSAGHGRQITLTELSAKCVALQISGSSTSLWVQTRTKIK